VGLEAGARQEAKKERTRRVDWAPRVRRTCGFDVFTSQRSGGRRRVLASLTAAGGVRAIVEHLGLPWWPAPRAPAPGPAPLAGW